MIRKIKDFIWNLLIGLKIGGAVQLLLTGYLKDIGWYRSFNTKKSVDKNGNPIPWCTYPYVEFISAKLNNSMEVFEYGSGNSTLWYAERVKKISVVEHDESWMKQLLSKLPSNVNLIYRRLGDGNKYVKSVGEEGKKYDIIIVDGRNRVECVKTAIDFLKPDGVMVIDNSNLSIYKDAIDFLNKKNYWSLDFYGISPVTPHTNCTSVFYMKNTENQFI